MRSINNYCSEDLSEWYEIVHPILIHPEFQKRKSFNHHDNISVYDHCINVSIESYKMAKRYKTDYKSASIAGLLHDFYEHKCWDASSKKRPFLQKHAFTHAASALKNSKAYFADFMNPVIENSILRHMFPLNKIPPKYGVGWIISLADKKVSMEVFRKPRFFLMTFLAIIGR